MVSPLSRDMCMASVTYLARLATKIVPLRSPSVRYTPRFLNVTLLSPGAINYRYAGSHIITWTDSERGTGGVADVTEFTTGLEFDDKIYATLLAQRFI